MDIIEQKKTRIAIAGIGGVGGYLGGKLAANYAYSSQVEIVFIARGEMAAAIQKNGLLLHSNGRSYHCFPGLTSDDPAVIGSIDILIVCTKSFSIAAILQKYAACLTSDSLVITAQNTVNGSEQVMPWLPEGVQLMEGIMYIASNIQKPGEVHHISGPATFSFGTTGEINPKGEKAAEIFWAAGIQADFTPAIQPILWKKFMFVSPIAIVTAMFDITFTGILDNPPAKDLYRNLVQELMQLAIVIGVAIDSNTIQHNLNLLEKFTGQVKSSFQLDLEQGKPAEVGALVTYVIKAGSLYGIPTPYYESSLHLLTKKYPALV